MISRRSFIGSILALAAAPAVVRADSLMRVIPRETSVLRAAEYTWHQEALVIVPFEEIVNEAIEDFWRVETGHGKQPRLQ